MSEVTISTTLDTTDLRELGSDAVFTISSAKPGNGVEQLRDNNNDTYWQSDGAFPHFINIQFLKKVSVSKICLYLDYSLDESYTPKKLSISSGTSAHDLIDIIVFDVVDPVGWITVDLSTSITNPEDESVTKETLRTHLLQVRVLGMHQNGKDTHIRQVKVLGPRASPRVMGDYCYDDFKTVEMSQFALLR
jgi:anaphase-promoting complex subunit 10